MTLRNGTAVGQSHDVTRRAWVFARAMLVFVAAATATAGAAAAAPEQNPKGEFLGVVKSAHASGRATPHALAQTQAVVDDLTYHGGPVMHTNRTHVIYWEPPGYSTTASYKSLVDGFLSDVAADAARHGNVYASDVQYTDGSGIAAYSSTFAGSIVATDAYPASGCTDAGTTVCLTDAQIRSEIDQVVASRSLPRGLGDIYFVMTPSGVGSCFDATPANGCAYTDYCAYHSSFNLGSGRTLYANQPYPNDPGCDSGQQPNGDLADSTINLISHEHNETITDPRGNAWFDSNGDENGDKCAWDFGTALGSTAGGQYNQLINGGQYYLQREWSNAPNAHGCVLTMPNNAPAAVFTSTPSSPAPGQAVSFDGTPSGDSDGTISGYSWDYGDGATGTGAAPSHTYVTSGTYPAKLTVTDNDGTPTSVTHSVIVSQPSSGAPPGGPAPTPGGGQTPSNDSSPAAGSPPASGLASLPPAVARLDIPTQQLILSSARRTGVVVRCGTGRRCAGSLTVSVTIPATGRRGSRVRTVVLGRAGFSVAALHTVTVRFALSRMAASLLSGHRRIRVRAAAVVANAVIGRASVSRSAWLVPAAKTKRR